MAKGPLRTFFRQDAGYPEMDEPDLTDALLDSMIQKRIGVGAPAVPTSAARMSGMSMMAGQGSIPENPQFNNANVQTGPAYPGMPGPPPAARPMPQMPRQGWGDVLAQALAGAGDVISVGGGRPTNYLGQVIGMQKGMRSEAFQQALAQRGAMEQAERLAHEYEWRKYAAGRGEEKQNFYEQQKKREADLYEKMIGEQNGKKSAMRDIFKFQATQTLASIDALEDLDKAYSNLLEKTAGDRGMMDSAKEAYDQRRGELMKDRGAFPYWPKAFFGGAPSQQAPPVGPAAPPAWKSANPWYPGYWTQQQNR